MKQTALHNVSWPHPISWGFKTKTEVPWGRWWWWWFYQQVAFGVACSSLLCLQPADFGGASLHNCMNQFLKINQPISQFSPPSLYIHYMHTFDWFCFSGEAWLIYCASPYSIFFNNQPQFISYCPLFPHQLLLWMLVLWPMMNGWSSIPTVIPAYLLCENIVLGFQGDLCGQKWHLCIEQLLCGPRRKTSEIKKCPGSYFGGQIKLKSIYNPSCVA